MRCCTRPSPRDADFETLTKGVGASPGAASGEIVFTADDAVAAGKDGRDVILVRPFTEADDVHGFHAAKGILTSKGGKASHAALVARGMGKPCVAGAGELDIDLKQKKLRVGDTELSEGDRIAIDGSTGVVTADEVPLEDPEVSGEFETVLEWADELRSLGVRTNADTAEDATKAREFGAEGIGLCRSEHIFLGTDHQAVMQAMIMAESDEERGKALDKLLELQREHFKELFDAMRGQPVTIRLLDPPLHEFIPNAEELAKEVERARIEESDELEELEGTLKRVHELAETNPMLGTRGVRLAILHPEIYEMQVRAIVQAALAIDERPELEVMIPLVAYEQELDLMRELVDKVIEEEGADDLKLLLGTMIELPRACFVADRIAAARGLLLVRDERPHPDRARLLARRRGRGDAGALHGGEDRRAQPLRDDRRAGRGLARAARGVGWPRGEARPEARHLRRARRRPRLDRASSRLAGLDYVSCSPYRVPVARVAAAQSAIRASSNP